MLYGGQAILKGVMMRSPKFFSAACRRVNNEISIRVEPIIFANRPAVTRWPLIRGSLALIDAMLLGIKALLWSANLAMEDVQAGESEKTSPKDKKKTSSGSINDIAIGSALVFGLGFGVFLFIILPNVIAGWFPHSLVRGRFALNMVEGVLRVTFFLLYISAVGMMRDIREVFQYHGAEHRAINTFEAGQALDLESTRQFGTIHVRCGTNFILIVLVLSIFVFSLLPWNGVIQRVAMRLVLLPLVAGIAYEIIRFAGRNADKKSVRAVLTPGLCLQYITTRPPSDDQVEVALAALNAVVKAEAEGLPQRDILQDNEPAVQVSGA